MIDIITKKTLRYLGENRNLQFKMALIFALLVTMAVLSAIVGRQEKELVKVKAQKELADRFPELKVEWEIKWKAELKAEWDKGKRFQGLSALSPEEQIEIIQRILEGTSYQNGVYQAVINGEVYAVGHEIGDYTITKITMEAITLEDKKRKKTQKSL